MNFVIKRIIEIIVISCVILGQVSLSLSVDG